MSHAALSEAVRQVVAHAGHHEDIHEIVDRARTAFVEAEGISLFGLETPHPDFGSVHWIVGQDGSEADGYLVLAIGDHSDTDSRPLFAASADDLADALRQLADYCGGLTEGEQTVGTA